jgi:hypothetical protein
LESVTGKQMGKSLPHDEGARVRLIARWRTWWKDEEPRWQPAAPAERP